MGAGTAGNTAVWIGLNYYGRKAKMLFEEWRTILKTKRADKKMLKHYSTAILFCVKNELSFCCCLEQKWKNKVDQWTGVDRSAKQCMQNNEMYAPVFFRITWNAWHTNYSVVWNAHFRLIRTPIFYQFTNKLLLLLSTLEILIYKR